MKNHLTATLAAIVISAALAPAAMAADGEVWMADFLLLRIRCPVAGYSITERVDAVRARTNDLLTLNGIELSSIRIETRGRDALIFAGTQLLVTVTPCDAKANRTTPEKLANSWANRLRAIYPDVVPKTPMLTPQPSPPTGG